MVKSKKKTWTVLQRILSAVLALCLIAVCFAGCTEKLDDADTSETAKPLSKKDSETAAPDFDLDFDSRLLSYFASVEDGNYMISPLSFRYALGLLLEGAEGDTKAELLTALGIESTEEWRQYASAFGDFVEQYDAGIAKEQKYSSVKVDRALRVADSVWKLESIGVDFKDTYLSVVSQYYDANLKTFTTGNAIQKINDWASEKTDGLIPELLPENYDVSQLAVVLMNALYFKDSWVDPFESAFTKDDSFKKADGTEVTKSFMKKTARYRYYSDEDTQLVVIPMEGNVQMAFVLGDDSDMTEKLSTATTRKVSVTIPKIDFESSFSDGEFMNFLKAYGAETLFTDCADFSAMIDYPICVSDIIQKTRIKLDEGGVEAAAVTAVMAKATGAGPDEETPVAFTADRPFSFYIYTHAGDQLCILFTGQIVE